MRTLQHQNKRTVPLPEALFTAGQRAVGKQPRGELRASGERRRDPGRPLPQEAGRSAASPRAAAAAEGTAPAASRGCWAGRAPGGSTATFATRGGGERHGGAREHGRAQLGWEEPGRGPQRPAGPTARPPLLPSPAARAGGSAPPAASTCAGGGGAAEPEGQS